MAMDLDRAMDNMDMDIGYIDMDMYAHTHTHTHTSRIHTRTSPSHTHAHHPVFRAHQILWVPANAKPNPHPDPAAHDPSHPLGTGQRKLHAMLRAYAAIDPEVAFV